MNSASKLQTLCAAALALGTFSSAHALTLCVNDPAVLSAQLSLAQFFTASPLLIKLVQGTYVMTNDLDYQLAPPTTIEGGYTPGCLSRSVNAANTVINIGLGRRFFLRQLVATPQAQLILDGFTFTNSDRGMTLTAGNFGDFSDDEGSVQLRNMRITNVSDSPDSPPLAIRAIAGSIKLENVLIDHMGVPQSCAVLLQSYSGAFIQVNYLTADLNGGNDFCIDDNDDPVPGGVTIVNSILWSSNASGGLPIFRVGPGTNTNTRITGTVYHSVIHAGPLPANVGQIDAAPGWVNPALANYRLSTNPLSVAINSTPNSVLEDPLTDIEGTTRFIGSTPDRGAFESLVSDQTTFTVTNTLDAGAGSLREAITLANQSITPPKLIQFDIPGTCPQVIGLTTLLPNINARMSIDGYSQPLSTANTSANGFNAKLCVLIKPASGTLASLLTVPANSFGSLTLRGLGIGGFGQPVRLLGGQNSVVAGNQFGGSQGGVALPSAGLNAISVGSSASGVLVGGINLLDRNFINGAGVSGIDNAATSTAAGSCQIVGNVISFNNFGINNTGTGCQIVGNRIYGNSTSNLWLNASNNNIVQRNVIGPDFSGLAVSGNTAVGILLSGTTSGNVIGAGGQGGSFTANTVRFNNGGGVVVRGDAALNNSINANLIYDNGSAANAMDIDLSPTGATSVGVGIAALSANDVGDSDTGPNQLQNFPVPVSLGYTGNGTGASMLDRPGIITVTLDSQPGTHRIDAYYASVANQLGLQGRGHGEIYLGHRDVFALFPAPVTFTMPVNIPTQLASGVISFTATDANGNTSEIGTGLSIVAPLIDDVFKNGFE